MAPPITVNEFYAGKTVFVTGATGFLGKVLVEKLLRSCPDVKKILILVRPKKGHSSKERLNDLLSFKAFDTLRRDHPDQLLKLQVVAGDVLADGLGLAVEDRALVLRETQVVVHCAACVRFDLFIRDALNLNTRGTKRVLDLASEMERLEVLVHVSTSYCRCEVEVLEEKVYPSPHKPQQVISCVEWMDDAVLKHLEPKLIEPQPNTYAYTKSLAEDLVLQYEGKFPIVIARPSIVSASYKEPIPGWVDNLNGPTGLLVGAGKGVIRTMLCNEDYSIDSIPVDLVANACILLAYTTALEKPKEVQVCNVTQSGINPVTWGRALELGQYHVAEFPFSLALWYPGGSIKSNWFLHQVAVIFTHFLPAYIIDFLLILFRKKTFMVQVQNRIQYGLRVLQYYTTKEWHFKNDNLLALRKKITKEDDDTFYTDISVIDWSSYVRFYIKGTREFCMKEDPATLPQSRRLHKRLYYLDRISKLVLYSLLVYFLYSYLKIFFNALNLNSNVIKLSDNN